jgi:hypothetical protein
VGEGRPYTQCAYSIREGHTSSACKSAFPFFSLRELVRHSTGVGYNLKKKSNEFFFLEQKLELACIKRRGVVC